MKDVESLPGQMSKEAATHAEVLSRTCAVCLKVQPVRSRKAEKGKPAAVVIATATEMYLKVIKAVLQDNLGGDPQRNVSSAHGACRQRELECEEGSEQTP